MTHANKNKSKTKSPLEREVKELQNKLCLLEKPRSHYKALEENLYSRLNPPIQETAEKYFDNLVLAVISAFKVKYAIVTECVDDPSNQINTLAFWNGDHITVDRQVELRDTPCGEVIKGKTLQVLKKVLKRFPSDPFLLKLNAESYVGVPLRDSNGKVIGHLAILDDKPMQDDGRTLLSLQIFAIRASSKLEHKKLKKNLSLIQFAFDRSSLPVYWVTSDARLFYVNQAAIRSLGYTQEELLSMKVHDIDPQFPASAWENHWTELRKKEVLVIESFHQAKNGRIFPVDLSVNYLEFEGQEYGCAFARDISEFQRAKKELDSQRDFLEQIININPNVIFAKDRQGRHTLVNQSLAEVYGDRIENIIGKTDADLNPNTNEVERIRKDDLEVMNSLQEKLIAEEQITDSLGEIHWYQTVKRPILDDNKICNQILGVATDITARKKMEEAVMESEKRFRLMADSAPVMIWMSDAIKKCTYFNQGWLDFTGRDIKDELGCGWANGVHPEDLVECKNRYAKAFDKRNAFKMEYRLKRSDGEYRWIFDTGVPRFTSKGAFEGYIGTCLDISDMKNAETQLRLGHDDLELRVKERTEELSDANKKLEREVYEHQKTEDSLSDNYQLLHAVLEGTTDGIYLKDIRGKYLMVNSAFASIVGKPKDEILQKTDRELLPAGIARMVRKEDKEVLRLGSSLTFDEFRVVKGENRTFLASMGLHRDHQGVPVGVIGVSRDITHRRQSEDSIRSSEARFRAIFEGAGIGMMIIEPDPEGRILQSNSALQKMFGYRGDELKKMTLKALTHPSDLRETSALGHKIIASSELRTIQGEKRYIRKDGTSCWASLTASMVQERVGKSKFIIGMLEDISDRKKAEQELQESREKLEIRVNERTAELSQALSEVERLKNRFQQENIYLQQEIKLTHNFEDIVFTSKSIKKILHNIEQISASNATVLILGETGTGKELIARSIHNLSSRKKRSLIKVNCATLPPHLIESELFGHEKGAFTGAHIKRIGRFELADEGSIFLDEIGDLPLELQSKLLRVLQEGEYERVGGHSTKKVNVRAIAATHHDLENWVALGKFREDLFYRLNVIPIKLPPLRERREDIPVLAKHFMDKFSLKTGKTVHSISENVLSKLMDYDWPGNIRELENVIERAIVLTHGNSIELIDPMEEPLQTEGFSQSKTLPTLAGMEKKLILEALELCNWIVQGDRGAAKRLGIPPSTLRDRIRKYKIKKSY